MKSFKPPQPPVLVKYCFRCGEQLKASSLGIHFDMNSGEVESYWRWRCKNKRFWNSHADFKTDETGSAYDYDI